MQLKFLLVLLALIAFAFADENLKLQGKWRLHTSKFGLSFSSANEEKEHFATFAERVKQIDEWNANPENTFKLAVNQFAHLSSEYIKANILMQNKVQEREEDETVSARAFSLVGTSWNSSNTSCNWTHLFGPIKDQGYCGSCYAIAANGVVEAAYSMKYGQVISLSDEQIIDCTYTAPGTCTSGYSVRCFFANERKNYGCYGGYSEVSLKYAQNTRLYKESDYPYVSYYNSGYQPSGECHTINCTNCTTVKVASYGCVGGNENQVAAYVLQNGPVTAYVDASQDTFLYYSSGVYNDRRCSKTTNHALVIVGFGTDFSTGQDYWLVRSSWGTSWGMNGYAKMARNKNGLCGIVTENYYATI